MHRVEELKCWTPWTPETAIEFIVLINSPPFSFSFFCTRLQICFCAFKCFLLLIWTFITWNSWLAVLLMINIFILLLILLMRCCTLPFGQVCWAEHHRQICTRYWSTEAAAGDVPVVVTANIMVLIIYEQANSQKQRWCRDSFSTLTSTYGKQRLSLRLYNLRTNDRESTG